MEKRFRFASDGEGHDYLIPAGEEEKFQNWLDAGPYWEDYTSKDYEDCRVGTYLQNFTFMDPQEDN